MKRAPRLCTDVVKGAPGLAAFGFSIEAGFFVTVAEAIGVEPAWTPLKAAPGFVETVLFVVAALVVIATVVFAAVVVVPGDFTVVVVVAVAG